MATPTPPAPKPNEHTLDFIRDVKLAVTVDFGRSGLSVERLLKLDNGSVIELDKLSGEPLDVSVNGKLVARGEAVIVNDRFGIRVTEIVSHDDDQSLEGK